MLTFYRVCKRIFHHPLNEEQGLLAVWRFIKWQINCKLNPYPLIYPYTENSKLIIAKGRAGATGNLYSGLLEYEDMAFLLHFLTPEDLFFDVGANVGAFTVLAGAQVGAKVVSFEPIPNTYTLLKDNIAINHMEDRVSPLNIGLGSEPGILKFTKSLDSVNHVATEYETNTIDVKVSTLDEVVTDKGCPILIKIDVEGFETEVINGAHATLGDGSLQAIIIELNGSGKRYGYDEQDIHNTLLEQGFLAYSYNPKSKKLKNIVKHGVHNTIYIRDIDFVESRIAKSKSIGITNHGKI